MWTAMLRTLKMNMDIRKSYSTYTRTLSIMRVYVIKCIYYLVEFRCAYKCFTKFQPMYKQRIQCWIDAKYVCLHHAYDSFCTREWNYIYLHKLNLHMWFTGFTLALCMIHVCYLFHYSSLSVLVNLSACPCSKKLHNKHTHIVTFL